MASIHQSRELTRLANESKLFRKMLRNIHENGNKFETLCILHVRAHEDVVCPITDANKICDTLAKETAKAHLLSKLPANISKPNIVRHSFSIVPAHLFAVKGSKVFGVDVDQKLGRYRLILLWMFALLYI